MTLVIKKATVKDIVIVITGLVIGMILFIGGVFILIMSSDTATLIMGYSMFSSDPTWIGFGGIITGNLAMYSGFWIIHPDFKKIERRHAI